MTMANCPWCKNNYKLHSQNRRNKFCSPQCYWDSMRGILPAYPVRQKDGIPWNKGKKVPQLRGENHPRWRGGTGTERHQAMGKVEYKLWRKAVFERDNYTCQVCFVRGCYLEADHIKPWSLFPELRYAIDNGRTLCKRCHIKTESYPKQLIPKVFRRIET